MFFYRKISIVCGRPPLARVANATPGAFLGDEWHRGVAANAITTNATMHPATCIATVTDKPTAATFIYFQTSLRQHRLDCDAAKIIPSRGRDCMKTASPAVGKAEL